MVAKNRLIYKLAIVGGGIMSENGSDPKPVNSRLVFIAVALIAFIWVCVFIILPGVTGKPGVAQQMQQDLRPGMQKENAHVPYEK
jgi:hypothetical protein